MRTIKFLIAICAIVLLAGCGGYIYMGDAAPSDGGVGVEGGDGSVVYDAPVVTVDPNSRATIIMEQPDGGADSWDVAIDEGDFDEDVVGDDDCGADDCNYNIPGLDPNKLYNVSVRYWKDGNLSHTSSVLLNTAFKELVAYGHVAEVNLGSALAVGDYNGDGNVDIVAGPRAGVGAGRVEIFRGPFQDSLEPTTILTSTDLTGFYGVAIDMADVTCDGRDDILVSQPYDAAGWGYVYVYEGDNLAAGGPYDEHPLRSNKLRGDAANVGFGIGLETIDDGTGCHDIIIGSPLYHMPGCIFRVDNSWLSAFEFDVGLSLPASVWVDCSVAPNLPGLFIETVGDDVLFNFDYTEAIPHRTTVLRFSDAIGVDWAGISTQFNADHEFAMGHLIGDDFFASEGVDVGGGFVNIYAGHASNIPVNILTSDTRNTFGVDAAVGDVYQAQPGLELLVGTETEILVYFGYVEGSGLSDVTPDAILHIPGRHINLVDANGDGYLDIISYERNADNGILSNVGSVNVNQ